MLELLHEVLASGRLSSVLLVDGSGILHQRHAGVACHLGVMASLPTVGVTKKHLFGQIDIEGMEPLESRPVLDGDNLIGTALRATARSRRPLFISPGHRTDVPYSDLLVRHMLTGRRLPEPLYWADRLSRRVGEK